MAKKITVAWAAKGLSTDCTGSVQPLWLVKFKTPPCMIVASLQRQLFNG